MVSKTSGESRRRGIIISRWWDMLKETTIVECIGKELYEVKVKMV